MKAARRAAITWRVAMALAAMTPAACTTRGNRTSEDWASVERAAISHDLKNDVDSLYRIAATRAKLANRELREKKVTCAPSNVDIQFVAERKAIYTASYMCGVVPWQPGESPPVAMPIIKLGLVKERSTWTVDESL